MESEEDAKIVDDESRPSSTGTGNLPGGPSKFGFDQATKSSTTFADRKLEMKKNMPQVSSLLNDFRDMAMDYSGALQLRYS